MNKLFLVSAVACGLLVIASACDSAVVFHGGANGSGAGDSGPGELDEDCYEECLEVGGGSDGCTERCTDHDWDGDDDVDGDGPRRPDHDDGPGTPGNPPDDEDEERGPERECFQCIELNGEGSCRAELDACEESLACKVLLTCPYECGADLECTEECKELLPTGVPTLTDLVNCLICNGGVCAEDCQGSVMESYCE